MNFRRPKQEVINKAHNAAISAGQMYMPDFMHNSPDSVSQQLRNNINMAISNGIRAAIESLVNDTYTDEEFENDIGINKP